MTIIVDAHQDIAMNYEAYGRDYQKGALNIRRMESRDEMNTRGVATLGLYDAILGRVAITFGTLFVAPAEGTGGLDLGNVSYTTPQEAYRHAMNQADYYHRLADENQKVRLIQTEADLDAVLATWADDKEMHEHHQGLVILMEGADPILEPKQFEEWYARGVRIVGLAWHETRYAGGTGMPGPLSDLGHELLEVMAGFNVVLDLSHIAEEAFFQALERYEGDSIIASHSNPRRFCNTDRHLSDEMIRLLAERDGVMGIVLYNRFLSNDWRRGDPKSDITMTTVIDAIDHVCQLTGSAAHVGIGSDFDGGFGAESTPEGFDTVTDLWNIKAALETRGYTTDDIDAILSGNMLRKLRPCLP